MPPGPPTIAEINALDRDGFVARLGHLFEGSPWVAEAAWPARPFASREQLHQVLCAAMYAAPTGRHESLIRAHPDLAGKAALAGDLTPESAREQSSAGLNQLTPDEFARFTELNGAYRERFAFPFIICVREHTKASILASFVDRIEHAREQEIQAALGEIAKIARLRLWDAVAE